MPAPRYRLVNPEVTPYYHVISRCVRQQFLCGFDRTLGRDFSHRRHWIERRIKLLSSVFAIEIYAYAVMSNHFHLVIKVNPDAPNRWRDRDIVNRWRKAFGGPDVVKRFAKGELLTHAEYTGLQPVIAEYRKRLASLSWFMRALNEPIARLANNEDNVTGRFWEGRFKSQALLTAASVLSAMAYVDLNPIRAGIANTPEESDFTSVKERIHQAIDSAVARKPAHERELEPIAGYTEGQVQNGIEGCTLARYLELVDYSGRSLHPDKPGSIPPDLPPLLKRLGIKPAGYVRYIRRQEKGFRTAIGPSSEIKAAAKKFKLSRLWGISAGKQLFSSA
ncbi:transposase [Spiribacter sp. C176]|uniref:Transposase n=1 Tax=Spiribacter salilacus TaxID=2664894 RepID=A0A6N7QS53_9GAMM|nr:transposase [Spiribacter salilacus]MRH78430.1 transposase [Spiribacter salilacus]